MQRVSKPLPSTVPVATSPSEYYPLGVPLRISLDGGPDCSADAIHATTGQSEVAWAGIAKLRANVPVRRRGFRQ